ncbi:MAG TPA: 50S ribosomal protein L22 [Fastidiosipila sp.]|nr:50S ribosomal protein L22 [Eubacteriales bacterium]MDD3611049.1 50S ribosomal protein L22 [Eubacteriales bacterium]HHU03589.1 50S ribosomal protein L22 [Fastidiosipila sp.]
MSRKVMSKVELEERREELIAAHKAETRRNKKTPVLTKKERKYLGIGRDEGRASVQHLRINSKKVNLLTSIIRGKSLREALAILEYSSNAAAQPLTKLLNSAAANAVNNNGLNPESLYVAEINATEGPTLKRIRPRAKGAASWILKRSSHVNVVLREREEEEA